MAGRANLQSVLVLEDCDEHRAWLCALLLRCLPGVRVMQAPTLEHARAVLERAGSPDMALIDIGLPDGCGIDLVHELSRNHPYSIPVIMTIFDDDANVFQALAAGAQGYVLKDADEDEVMHHLVRIRSGAPPISPAIARRLMAHFRVASVDERQTTETPRLTPRETDVLRYIGRGLRVAEAARLLGLTENTVSGYVKALYRKLNVSSRAEVAIEAARRGLL